MASVSLSAISLAVGGLVGGGHAVQRGEGSGDGPFAFAQGHGVGGVVAGLLDEDQGLRGTFGRQALRIGLDRHTAVDDEGVVIDGLGAEVGHGVLGLGQIGFGRFIDRHGLFGAVEVEDLDAVLVDEDEVFFPLVPVDGMHEHGRPQAPGRCGIHEPGHAVHGRAAFEEVRHRGEAVDLFLALGGQADVLGLLADAGDEVGDGRGNELAHAYRSLPMPLLYRAVTGRHVPVGGRVPLMMLGLSALRSSACIWARARASSCWWKAERVLEPTTRSWKTRRDLRAM